MIKGSPSAAVRVALAARVLVPFPRQASAQTLVEHSAEARFQLDVRVPDAALAAFLPAGFALNVSTQGAAHTMQRNVSVWDARPPSAAAGPHSTVTFDLLKEDLPVA